MSYTTVPIHTPGAAEVIIARNNQVTREGFDNAHDDQHVSGEMVTAAMCYAMHTPGQDAKPPRHWPWDRKWWKPRSRRDNLVRAAALLIAEIDRIDRATNGQKKGAH